MSQPLKTVRDAALPPVLLLLLVVGYAPWLTTALFFLRDENDRWETEHGYEADSWTVLCAVALAVAVAVAVRLTRSRQAPILGFVAGTLAGFGLVLALFTAVLMAHPLTRDPQGNPLRLGYYWTDAGFVAPLLVAVAMALGWGLWRTAGHFGQRPRTP